MYMIHCWMEHPVRQLDQTFSYLFSSEIEKGTRVLVDFNGKKIVGFVDSCEVVEQTQQELEAQLGYSLKFIEEVIDESTLLSSELHDLAKWLSDTTLSTRISCYQAMLPAKMKPALHAKAAVQEKWVSVSEQEVSLTPKQLEAFLYVKDHGPMKYSSLRKEYPNQAKTLLEKGVLISYEKAKEASQQTYEKTSYALPLQEEQNQVLQEIQTTEDAIYLLHGVTGSGKTEVYLQLAEQVLQEGKQVLFLVPEIGLTPQMIERVTSRFGLDLAIYHSRLNDQEKYEQYQKVKNRNVNIVVGTRSAIFLPFDNLGLIVIDEEHDSSYKQENQPAYHCRDVAIWRGNYHHCKVILGSATPSLESYARGLKGVYHLLSLPHRINDTLPEITVVSLKDAMKHGESYMITNLLKEKISDRLEHHQQVILLLNRRGYSTQLRCKNCQEVILCPHCELAMSYHRDEKVMKCHTCGTVIPVPQVCPSCGMRAGYSAFGFGTQRLEQELQGMFPKVKLLRMDADTTTKKNSHEKILTAFGNGEADILLGTQMIAKGLDYPNVTLVGILNGDEGLSRSDYRSCETTFDLLMQASGRSGRANHKGEVVLQVFDQDHYVIQSALQQNYEFFFQQEMAFRHTGQYPPYTYLISLVISGRNQTQVNEQALRLKESLQGEFKTIGVIPLLKINDQYRNRILLKGKDLDVMRNQVAQTLQSDEFRSKNIKIDVNPITLD